VNQWEFFFDMNQFFKKSHTYLILGRFLLYLELILNNLLKPNACD